jgi:hypothetical protein
MAIDFSEPHLKPIPPLQSFFLLAILIEISPVIEVCENTSQIAARKKNAENKAILYMFIRFKDLTCCKQTNKQTNKQMYKFNFFLRFVSRFFNLKKVSRAYYSHKIFMAYS